MPDELPFPETQFIAIGDKVAPILEAIPQEKRAYLGMAAMLETVEVYDRLRTPWTIIFTNEGIDKACEKLLNTLHTPDHQSWSYDADIAPAIPKVLRILEEEKVLEMEWSVRKVFAYITLMGMRIDNPLQALKNIKSNSFELYIDESRNQFNDPRRWEYKLLDQFDYDQKEQAKRTHVELFRIIDETEKAAVEYIQNTSVHGNADNHLQLLAALGSDVKTDYNRSSVLSNTPIIEIPHNELLIRAWKSYEDLLPYREKTYTIRSLQNLFQNPYEEEMRQLGYIS